MAIQMQCGQCAKEFTIDSRPSAGQQVFCVFCGAPNSVSQYQGLSANVAFARASRRESSRKLVNVVVILVVLAGVAAAGYYVYTKKFPTNLQSLVNEFPDDDVIVAGDLERILDGIDEGSASEVAALNQMLGAAGAGEFEQVKALLPAKGQRGTFAACVNTQSLEPEGLVVISPRSMDESKIKAYISSRPGAVKVSGSTGELWSFGEAGDDPAVAGIHKGKIVGGRLKYVNRYIKGIPSSETFGANEENRKLLGKLPSNAVMLIASGRLAEFDKKDVASSLGAKRGAAAVTVEGISARINGIGEFKDEAAAKSAQATVQMFLSMGAAQLKNSPYSAGLKDSSCTQEGEFLTLSVVFQKPDKALAGALMPNLARSSMGANETAAVASCKAFAEAQDIYRRTDYNRDGVLEYATRLRGNNSLYETTAGQADVGLIDRTMADAEGNPGEAKPRAGYCFKVLTGQGPGATGGERSYISMSPRGVPHMTLGYALLAYPDDYGKTGRNTFIINNAGNVYQQDLGVRTLDIVKGMKLFDPDMKNWLLNE